MPSLWLLLKLRDVSVAASVVFPFLKLFAGAAFCCQLSRESAFSVPGKQYVLPLLLSLIKI